MLGAVGENLFFICFVMIRQDAGDHGLIGFTHPRWIPNAD